MAELTDEEYVQQIRDSLDASDPEKIPEKKYRFLKFDSTKNQLNELVKLVKSKAPETDLHNFLEANRTVFSFALYAFQTGHHGSYVFSKQQILPRIQGVSKGLIPDFIVGGENSDGIQWWIVELKGASENIFVEESNSNIKFSQTANSAVFQLLRYIDTCSEIQSQLRDTFKMTSFREPNGLIIMGTEDEFKGNANKQKMKAAWNRLHPKKLEIRTYDWLLRNFIENDQTFNFPLIDINNLDKNNGR